MNVQKGAAVLDNKTFSLNNDFWRAVLIGTGVGAVVTTLMLFLMAFVLTLRDFSLSSAAVFSCIALGIGGFVGGFAASKKLGSRGMVIGSVTGAALYVLILIASLIVSESGITAFSLIKAVIVIVSAALGGITGVNLEKKKKYV